MKGDLTIRFSGLKEGFHDFHIGIGNEFFDQLDYSEIKKAELNVAIQFEKKPNMLILNFNLQGKVEVMCDKCTDDFYLNIESQDEFIYKFGEGESDDEKIIIIPENEIELDVSQQVYELVVTAIPSKRLHDEGQCNQEMLKAMDDYLMVEADEVNEDSEPSDENNGDDQEIDPRWSALKNLKK